MNCFVLDQQAEFDFYSATCGSLKELSTDKHVDQLGLIFPTPNQPLFCSYFLMIRAWQKYHCSSLWCDLIGVESMLCHYSMRTR
jgi:hypothetical protein